MNRYISPMKMASSTLLDEYHYKRNLLKYMSNTDHQLLQNIKYDSIMALMFSRFFHDDYIRPENWDYEEEEY